MTDQSLFLIVSSDVSSNSTMRVILTFLICLISSCAYYNTFYNAQKYYSEAQSSKKNKEQFLNKCIEKCAKVIEYYPGSRWVDDAIFLMGKCFYEKRDYPSARRKFEELLSYFPNSPFMEEATLFLGKSYLSEGEYALAMEAFAKLENTKLRCDALFHKGEAMYVAEDYESAANAYQNLLESCSKTEYREEALENLASSLLRMAEYSTAIELYQSLLEGELTESERVEISLRISDAYLDMDDPEKALVILLKVDEEIQDNQNKARVKLKFSGCYRKLDRLDEAIQSLEEASQLSPKSEISALSYYYQGVIYEDELLDFEKAKEAYGNVATEHKTAKVSKEAAYKVATFERIEDFKSKLLEENVDNPAEIQFLLAELLLMDLNKEDMAIEEYQKLLTQFEDSVYTPKAIYAIGWIYKNRKADTLIAEEYYRRLIEEYSETEYADRARKFLNENGDSE